MPPNIPTQDELRDRETAIVEDYRAVHGNVPFEAVHELIIADRLERWGEFVGALEIPDALQKWAGMMGAIHGPNVLMHRGGTRPGYPVDWITALLVVRYGEAEYFWPEELGDEDLARARAWLSGKAVPAAITFLMKEA